MRRKIMSLARAALIVILMPTAAAQKTVVHIDNPPANAKVDQRQEITGYVSPASAKLWVVIRPIETSDYWVQPPVNVGNDGKWTVKAYFGEPGPAHSGKGYEVRAIANPTVQLREGRGEGWPPAAAQSDVKRYTRR